MNYKVLLDISKEEREEAISTYSFRIEELREQILFYVASGLTGFPKDMDKHTKLKITTKTVVDLLKEYGEISFIKKLLQNGSID